MKLVLQAHGCHRARGGSLPLARDERRDVALQVPARRRGRSRQRVRARERRQRARDAVCSRERRAWTARAAGNRGQILVKSAVRERENGGRERPRGDRPPPPVPRDAGRALGRAGEGYRRDAGADCGIALKVVCGRGNRVSRDMGVRAPESRKTRPWSPPQLDGFERGAGVGGDSWALGGGDRFGVGSGALDKRDRARLWVPRRAPREPVSPPAHLAHGLSRDMLCGRGKPRWRE